jgi:hypothetical protein
MLIKTQSTMENYPTSDTDDPINTKICMVDYVGDMIKPYQNGVDRIQGGGGLHRYATCNKKFPVFFSVFISINERTAPNGWSDFDG